MSASLLREIERANFHRGGIKCLKLFHVDDAFFATLKSEVRQLAEANMPSTVGNKMHVTNWTKPYGTAIQYSLLNTSGKFDDTSTDHSLSIAGKSFHHAATYPTIAKFIAMFPHAINMRLNGMGHKSGLSPHEENVMHRVPGSRNHYMLRARFHLPIMTNPSCEMLLDGDLFHFAEGNIYYFNNGAVHSALNQSETEFRYHLVWDMMVSHETEDLMFSDGVVPSVLMRFPKGEQRLQPTSHIVQKEYQTSGPGLEWYKKLKLEKIGVKPWQFQNVYNAVDARMPRQLEYAVPDVALLPTHE